MSPPGQKVSNMLLMKSGGQSLITPERMKQLGQSRNDAQLWMKGNQHCVVIGRADAEAPIFWSPHVKS